MKIIGVDLHARQQTIAMLDDGTGELVEKELKHEGGEVREFYFALPQPALVGIEATGSMYWFLSAYSKNSKSNTASVTLLRSGRPNHASRKLTAEMPACFSSYWRRIVSLRSGCRLASSAICRFCCGIATDWFECERAYNKLYSR